MSEEISKGRSPNSPKFDLGQAIELTKKLYEKIGRSAVKADVAVGALGYSGINGAAMTTLGTISQYGLVHRGDRTVQVTPLALKILHPVDDAQKSAAIREAALNPKVFKDIHANWNDMTEDVLSNHLIHQNFTPETAKRTASVYKLNYSIASLGKLSSNSPSDKQPTTPIGNRDPKTGAAALPEWLGDGSSPEHAIYGDPPSLVRAKVLATFKVPLGSSEAELIFTGDRLEPVDFDALRDYVDLFKKQYMRKAPSVVVKPVPGKRGFPAKAIWKNKDHDQPIVVTGETKDTGGMPFYIVEGSNTAIPAAQVEFI